MVSENSRGRFSKPKIGICIDKLTALVEANEKCAVVKLYLENFKSFNDSFGYAFGGLLIDEISSFLETIDGADSYHIRGVEYIIIINRSSQQSIKAVLDIIIQRFEQPWQIDNYSCICSVNAGVVYLPGFAETADEVLENLGQAINESVNLGQNHLVEYNEKLRDKFLRHSIIAQQIPAALKNGAVEMFFQPIYSASAKRFARIDGFMRMHCVGIGFINRTEFVSVAEQSGQIYAVTQFAIAKACELIAELIAKDIAFETVAIKVSSIQLLQEQFYSDVVNIITEAGIPASRLAFEVNESTLYSAFAQVHVCMEKLSTLGIEMVLSGFGSGSFGIHQILSMSIDVVKTTRPLIWQMENTPNGAFLMDGLISICRNIGLKLIAEGVDTQAQAQMLESFGCEYQQGLFYSQSVPAEQLIEMMSK